MERHAAATQIRTNKILHLSHLFIGNAIIKYENYTCNPHDRKTLCAHGRPLHETIDNDETKENVMKTFQFVSSFRRELGRKKYSSTLASQVSF
jgi:hypothetical protein